MYRQVYKCRLCGEKFAVGKKYTDKGAIKKIVNMEMILPPLQCSLGYTTHGCKDGSYGLAELQGFKKVED